MQHPIMSKSVSSLSDSECLQAYDLIKQLIDLSVNEEYTQLDYIQMARLKYHLGELAYQLNTDNGTTILHYKALPHLLEKEGSTSASANGQNWSVWGQKNKKQFK